MWNPTYLSSPLKACEERNYITRNIVVTSNYISLMFNICTIY